MRKIIPQHYVSASRAFQKQALRLRVSGLLFFAILIGTLPAKLYAQAPAISYSGPQNLVLNTAIIPLSPSNSGGSVSTPGYSSTTVSVFSGTSYGQAFVFDASGNIYTFDYSNSSNRKLVKLSPTGTNPVTLISFLSRPEDITIDASGNVYALDGGSLYKITPGGTVSTVQTISGSPTGVAVDASGNLYVSTYSSSVTSIIEVPAAGGGNVNIGSGLSYMTDVTVDAAGNLYVCNDGDASIKKIAAGTGTVTTIASGFTQYGTSDLSQITVDPSGNIFFSEANGSRVSEIPAGSSTPTQIGSGFFAPGGLVLDATGDLYVIDSGALKEIKPVGGYYISPSLPAGLSFDGTSGTISGTPTATSAAADYKVTASNSSGSASANINITVSGSVSTDDKLSNLTISYGAFSPSFSPSTFSYAEEVPNSVTSVTLTPTADFANETIKTYGGTLPSGTASVPIPLAPGVNTVFIQVFAQDGVTKNIYSVAITRDAASSDATLSNMVFSKGVLNPGFAAGTITYVNYIPNITTSLTVTPTTHDPNATVTVNGTTVTSGSPSASIPLAVGSNTITTIIKAQDGTTTKTYTVNVIRSGSKNDFLSSIRLNPSVALTEVTGPDYKDYTASVSNTTATVEVIPTTAESTSTVTVNGVGVASGIASGPIPLNAGPNTITLVVTAQNGVSTKTYVITVTRAAEKNDNLSAIRLNPFTPISEVSGPDYKDYTASVSNGVSSIQLIPTTAVATSSVTVNGVAVASGVSSDPIALNVGANTITTVVTAQDGVSTHTYVVTVTRAASAANTMYERVSVSNPTDHPQMMDEEINVHPSLSPNGDGINDFLMVDGISKYPDNKLHIMNRSGALVFEAKGYDNSNNVFDGHGNKNGAMQLPGTYFYSLDYVANGTTKHKTGFIVLKY